MKGDRALRLFSLLFAFFVVVSSLAAQEPCPPATTPLAPLSAEISDSACLGPQSPQQNPQSQPPPTPDATNNSAQGAPGTPQQPTPPADPNTAKPLPQPKRILGVMPNFRAVSADTLPPPPTPKESFVIATQNTFDYSSFVFTGVTSLMAEGTNTHPQLGKGVAGFGRYYWRGFLDKVDGNYFVIFVLPTVFHQDERYYSMGKGGFWKRATYSASRVLITPNYDGHNTFNTSEVLGRAIAQGVSVSYYPSQARTPGALASKYGFAIGRDALTNVFREFWPDIAVHVLHRHP